MKKRLSKKQRAGFKIQKTITSAPVNKTIAILAGMEKLSIGRKRRGMRQPQAKLHASGSVDVPFTVVVNIPIVTQEEPAGSHLFTVNLSPRYIGSSKLETLSQVYTQYEYPSGLEANFVSSLPDLYAGEIGMVLNKDPNVNPQENGASMVTIFSSASKENCKRTKVHVNLNWKLPISNKQYKCSPTNNVLESVVALFHGMILLQVYNAFRDQVGGIDIGFIELRGTIRFSNPVSVSALPALQLSQKSRFFFDGTHRKWYFLDGAAPRARFGYFIFAAKPMPPAPFQPYALYCWAFDSFSSENQRIQLLPGNFYTSLPDAATTNFSEPLEFPNGDQTVDGVYINIGPPIPGVNNANADSINIVMDLLSNANIASTAQLNLPAVATVTNTRYFNKTLNGTYSASGPMIDNNNGYHTVTLEYLDNFGTTHFVKAGDGISVVTAAQSEWLAAFSGTLLDIKAFWWAQGIDPGSSPVATAKPLSFIFALGKFICNLVTSFTGVATAAMQVVSVVNNIPGTTQTYAQMQWQANVLAGNTNIQTYPSALSGVYVTDLIVYLTTLNTISDALLNTALTNTQQANLNTAMTTFITAAKAAVPAINTDVNAVLFP